MPPKAKATATRGRPKKTAAHEPAPVANASKKRGRVAETQDATGTAAHEPPKKRGRQAKVQVEEASVVKEAPKRGRRPNVAPLDAPANEAPTPKKRVGRPPKSNNAAVEAPAENVSLPKKRVGRPPKTATAPLDAVTAAPKRRSRGPATALDLSRVAGSPRVTKSRVTKSRFTLAHPRSAPKKAVAAPRLNPRLRSKLRTRQPATPKVKQQAAPTPTKRRGRPPKAETQQVAEPKQAKGAQKAAVKPVAPRKKRGITTIEVPDKYAAQVKQYLEGLIEADVVPESAEATEEEIVQVEDEDTGPGAAADDEEEEGPITIVEEEVIITSATVDAVEEEDVQAPGWQLDGAEPTPEAGIMDVEEALDAPITSDVAVDLDAEEHAAEEETPPNQDEPVIAVQVELNLRETAVVEDVMDNADAMSFDLNHKDDEFGTLLPGSSEDLSLDGTPPDLTASSLFGPEMLSL